MSLIWLLLIPSPGSAAAPIPVSWAQGPAPTVGLLGDTSLTDTDGAGRPVHARVISVVIAVVVTGPLKSRAGWIARRDAGGRPLLGLHWSNVAIRIACLLVPETTLAVIPMYPSAISSSTSRSRVVRRSALDMLRQNDNRGPGELRADGQRGAYSFVGRGGQALDKASDPVAADYPHAGPGLDQRSRRIPGGR